MRVSSVAKLGSLSVQELEAVVLESLNSPAIRWAALQRWRALLAKQHAGHDPWATRIGATFDDQRNESGGIKS